MQVVGRWWVGRVAAHPDDALHQAEDQVAEQRPGAGSVTPLSYDRGGTATPEGESESVSPTPFDDASRPAAAIDVSLTCQVIERILDDPRLTGEHITVGVQNRVVTLSGWVTTLYARIAAAELARSTPGVADICNQLSFARAADVSLALLPDAFDELVAHWDEPAASARPDRTRLYAAGAAAITLVTAILWLMLSL